MMEIEGSKELVFDRSISFKSFGLIVRLESNRRELLNSIEQTARKALLDDIEIIENVRADRVFGIAEDEDGYIHLYKDGVYSHHSSDADQVLELFVRHLRVFIAGWARDTVFVHAGVVEWKGKAIVIPADSGKGKTTLVLELVKLGAGYFSDEYAVLDAHGLVHPFARDLSVREPGRVWSEKNGIPIENFGGRKGKGPVPIGWVILAEFEENATWEPQRLTHGEGVIHIVQHTITLPEFPEFSMKVLKLALESAIILKGSRGDACGTAKNILSFCENSLN